MEAGKVGMSFQLKTRSMFALGIVEGIANCRGMFHSHSSSIRLGLGTPRMGSYMIGRLGHCEIECMI